MGVMARSIATAENGLHSRASASSLTLALTLVKLALSLAPLPSLSSLIN
jgi:hypothetical protein